MIERRNTLMKVIFPTFEPEFFSVEMRPGILALQAYMFLLLALDLSLGTKGVSILIFFFLEKNVWAKSRSKHSDHAS